MSLNEVVVTPLARIATAGGDVLHAMKQSDAGYAGFGEAYFSWVDAGAVKAWKRHTRMTMNVIVPVGNVRFVFRLDGTDELRIEEIGVARYARITVPPGIWFGFQGLAAPQSLVLNIANIPHDPNEVERLALSEIKYEWS
ncbi:MAG TPA: dTDP-4-dehydrorhamnose 3,5-epimerase [Gallionellaceae bacterium]|nr:dTDP-4-dehydrorhamnose 3,5-epimerase [Gallionellaceae bacterium]